MGNSINANEQRVYRADGPFDLSRREMRLQFALDAAGLGTFVWYPQEDRAEPDSRTFALFDQPDDAPMTLEQTLTMIVDPRDAAAYARAVAQACDPSAESGGKLNEEIRIKRADGTTRWLAITGQVNFAGEPPKAIVMAGTAQDITARKIAEEAMRGGDESQRQLLTEMQHRVRSALSALKSIVSESAQTSDTLDDFVAHLDGRIGTLSRVQTIALRNPFAGFGLAELLFEELRACAVQEGTRFTLEGPDVRLDARTAQTIALLCHELATNALKFGALSNDEGRVDVLWEADLGKSEPWIVLHWRERGGPAVSAHRDHSGFGLLVLDKLLPDAIGATVSYGFAPRGFHCSVAFPLER